MTQAIQPLIDQLQSLAKTNDHSTIHIDLMIDTTKKIYEVLHQLKYQTEASIVNPVPQVISNSFQNHINQVEDNTTTHHDMNDELEALFNSEYDEKVLQQPIEEIQELNLAPTPSIENKSTSANNPTENIVHDIAPKQEPAIDIAEIKTKNHHFEDGISFEFPSSKNISTQKNNTSNPTLNTTTESELQSEAVIEKIAKDIDSKPISGQGFVAPSAPHQKDFRMQIGFNDRYLFLNELFQNDKDLFEHSISNINNLPSLSDAKSWIDKDLSSKLNWDKNDTTVQTFYSLVDKYFKTI